MRLALKKKQNSKTPFSFARPKRKGNHFIFMFLTLILVLKNPQPSFAAEIIELEECQFQISGLIERGDGKKFDLIFSRIPCSYNTLFLDSVGGDVNEALTIAKRLYRTNTVLVENSTCRSACALIFMAGHVCAGLPYYCVVTREKHKSASLGFHAPFVQETKSKELVPSYLSFSAAMRVFSEILDAFSEIDSLSKNTGSKRNIIDLELFVKMFSMPPDQYFFIEENDQYFYFSIGVLEDFPEFKYPVLGRYQVFQLCYNLIYSEFRGWNYSKFGFSDYGWGILKPEEHITGSFERLEESWQRKNRISVQYMKMEGINLGHMFSGWCRVAPRYGSGYISVDFFDELNPPDTGSTEGIASSTMHYSMTYPLRTPVNLIDWQTSSDPRALVTVKAYFDQLGSERYGYSPENLWVPSKREEINERAKKICFSEIDKIIDFVNSDRNSSVFLDVTLKLCEGGKLESYKVKVDLVRFEDEWLISSINFTS